MIPVSSSYNLQGLSSLNFNNLLANSNQSQTTLPLSALGNILQLHCNPSLTLQVNTPSPLIPVSTKDSSNQDHINTLRSIYPNQSSYQNISQQDQPIIQCTNTVPRNFNQLLQELISTYQAQQDSLSQITIKYNFLLNAMERLLFDVQNNVEYSLLALGISQTISKVKLNQLNQLNQLNCAPLISNGVIPLIGQSHIFNNYTHNTNHQGDPIATSTGMDLTNQRMRSDSITAVSVDKKSEASHSESNISTSTCNSKPMKMTSLDKLDKLIDETVKKSTGRITVIEDIGSSNLKSSSAVAVSEDNSQSNVIDINANMGSAIHQIIRQFYQNASSSMNLSNNGLISNSSTETNFPKIQHSVARLQTDNLKSATNNFSQQVTEIFANSQIPFSTITNRPNQSFILCNNLPTTSIINGQHREPFVVAMNNSYKENNIQIIVDTLNETNNTTEDTESTSNREEEDLCLAELDPTDVATKIRDILSLHSIGQRLFAKHVLNLSQGTVSELLSKPKPWSKLSEKGRDSYRKMNQWAQDSTKVQELKSIAPRKGFSGHYAGMSPATPIKEDHETQEKIKRILNDAKMAMASSNSQSNVEEEIFSCYNKLAEPTLANIPSDSSQLTTVLCNSIQPVANPINNVLEFDISELQKKITAALNSTVGSDPSRQESVSQMSASTAYQQSPLIVMNLANIVPCSSSLVVSTMQSAYPSVLPVSSSRVGSNNVEKYHTKLEFKSVQAPSFDETEFINVKTEANICADEERDTDSLVDNGTCMKMSSDQIDGSKHSLKSIADLENLENFLKSFIGSIKLTENCFQNEEINTAELVNVIKDHLTKNSISQRTFGCLLGLSQGTVSDILSRPKPWSMLTNKGREPYIRMLKYLLKPTYFKVIENNGNKNGIIQNSMIESIPNSSSSPSSSDVALAYDQPMTYYNNHMSDHADNDQCNNSSSTEGRDYQSWDEDIPTINVDAYDSSILNLDQLQTENLKFDDPKEKIFNISKRIASMDTVALTNNVKQILNNHNLGQRVFGEHILNLSQASVSDLLSKPKKWNQLSLKGREPYMRMHLWLQHSDRLQVLCKNSDIKTGESGLKESENSNRLAIYDVEDSYLNSPLKINSKATRVILTDAQKSELKHVLEKCQYPSQEQISELAKKLGLSVAMVENGFSNQRIKTRTKQESKQNTNIVNKLESLSEGSEMNSEKSLPMNIEDIFESSDSENSISAPHLYPESNLQDNVYQDKVEDDDENGNYYSGNQQSSTVAGSNKRKRTNPIKLEMIVNKTMNKDGDEHYVTNNEQDQMVKENSFAIKVQKLDQNYI